MIRSHCHATSPCDPPLRFALHRASRAFVNHFEGVAGGTRYTVRAAVHIRQPLMVLAPLLRGVVARAVRRYTVLPLRAAALAGVDDRSAS